jgi:triosephosphate isomerase
MLIVANWKAYVDTRERAKKLFAVAKRLATSVKRVKIILAPSAPYLGLLAIGNRSRILFAGQDISTTTIGSATGEVTGTSLKNAGATHVIIGHSERRALGETDEIIRDKVRRAIANGLSPIVCVGETERDHDARYLMFIKKQIASVFAPLSPQERMKVVVAYEPVWVIGKSAHDALPERELGEMVLYIRKILGEYLKGRSAQKIPVLYGGSVEAGNIRSLAGGSSVDGFLVGHASADPIAFTALVKALV